MGRSFRRLAAGAVVLAVGMMGVVACAKTGSDVPRETTAYGLHPFMRADLSSPAAAENNADQKARIWAAYMVEGIRYTAVANGGNVRVSIGEPIVQQTVTGAEIKSRDRMALPNPSGEQMGFLITEMAVDYHAATTKDVRDTIRKWPTIGVQVSVPMQDAARVHLIPLRGLVTLVQRLYAAQSGTFVGTAYVLKVEPGWKLKGTAPADLKRYTSESTEYLPKAAADGNVYVEVDFVVVENFVGPNLTAVPMNEVPATLAQQWSDGVILPKALHQPAPPAAHQPAPQANTNASDNTNANATANGTPTAGNQTPPNAWGNEGGNASDNANAGNANSGSGATWGTDGTANPNATGNSNAGNSGWNSGSNSGDNNSNNSGSGW